jgi:hypothetical protein
VIFEISIGFALLFIGVAIGAKLQQRIDEE